MHVKTSLTASTRIRPLRGHSLVCALLAVLGTACSGDDPEGSTEAGSASTGGTNATGTAGTSGNGGGGNAGTGAVTTPPTGDAPSLDDLATAPAEEVPWTILVYGHADHNLSFSLMRDMEEMAAAQLGSAVQLVVLADWDSSQAVPGSDPPIGFPEGLQLYRIEGGGEAPTLLAQAGEANLDDPAALAEIVRAVFAGLPAQRRGLVLWDHGGAWSGGFGGDSQNGTFVGGTGPMGAQLVAEAVRAGVEAAGITDAPPLDFIAFDTCLMAGAEVAFPFRELTDIYIAAAEIDYGNGWDYEATLSHFAQNPTAPMSELAIAEVGHWDAHHASDTPNDALLRSHAALDLSQLDAFATATATLTGLMVDSTTFDPLELGRSAFFALSPYSSQFQEGSSQPGLRDIGQMLDALGSIQSDPAVAEAATAARSALANVVLASSQGSLRAGTQIGMHVEQTLGSNLTPARLQAYRELASDWVTASRWDELLELASAASDDDPPVFGHAIVNGEGASRAAPPTLQFLTEDATAAKAAVHAAVLTASNTVVTLGLVGTGLVDADVTSEFQWDGSVIGFADGQPGMLDVWLDVTAGNQPILTIPGVIEGVSSEPLFAYLVFGAEDANASVVVVAVGDTASTHSTFEIVRAFPTATFTPTYLEYGAAPQPLLITGDPMDIPEDGFPLVRTYVPAGSYYLTTSVSDIWGNTGGAFDTLTLLEPLGP